MCAPPVDEAADLALEALVDALVEVLVRATPEEVWTPVQRWRAAEEGDAETCMGPASIWDVAMVAGRPPGQIEMFGDVEPEPAPVPVERLPRTVERVQRLKGRTIVSGLAFPAGRWTDERAERERIRRAKQVVPKPSAAARVCRFGSGAA